jgi:hypothetical protein
MKAIIILDPITLEEELVLTNDVQYIDNHVRYDVEHDDYAPYRFVPKELVVLVKHVSMLQLTDAIKAL